MEEGTLEVLLVNAQGIRHTNIIGTPSYYVIVECGTQCQSSKTSSGKHEKPLWNQKLIFQLSLREWKELNHLTFRVMDTELFTNGGFVGETKVDIKGMIIEGSEKGYIALKPTPYNVVLEDNTYKGQMKIGFKFVTNSEIHSLDTRQVNGGKNQKRTSICSSIINMWRVSWWKLLSLYSRKSKNKIRKS